MIVNRLGRFLTLPDADRRLLVQAFLVLGVVRLGLWLFSLARLRRLLAGAARVRSKPGPDSARMLERLDWALITASRYLPGTSTCLTQALSAQLLLARQGCSAQVHIGVARIGERPLEAHAWVESAGRVVVGQASRDQYTPLTVLEPF